MNDSEVAWLFVSFIIQCLQKTIVRVQRVRLLTEAAIAVSLASFLVA
jgi:hypothetical protein